MFAVIIYGNAKYLLTSIAKISLIWRTTEYSIYAKKYLDDKDQILKTILFPVRSN